MKNSKMKLSVFAMAALFAVNCAGTDYTDPAAVTKTGTSITGTYTALDLSVAPYTPPTVAGGVRDSNCSSWIAAAGGSTDVLINSTFSYTVPYLTMANPGAGGATKEACAAGTLATIPNPKLAGASDFKWTLSGTMVIPEAGSATSTNFFSITRAFQGDLDGDGLKDTIAYVYTVGTTTNNAGLGAVNANVYITRLISFTNLASPIITTYGTGAAIATQVVQASSAGAHNAAITTAGTYDFTLTHGSASTAGLSTITLTLSGAAGGTQSATTIAAEDNTLAMTNGTTRSGIRYKGVDTSIWSLLTSSSIPANGLALSMGSKYANALTSNMPRLKNLKLVVN